MPNSAKRKRCFIQIDLDDNQWVSPRQKGGRFDILNSRLFTKAFDNLSYWLADYPLTLFVVGQDMQVKEKRELIKRFLKMHPQIEIANHTFSHYNNFLCLAYEEKEREILDADRIIRDSLGLSSLKGFRSSGYVWDKEIEDILKRNGYLYDASLLPTYYAPVLRFLNFYFNKIPGYNNFGHFRNGFLSNEPILLNNNPSFFQINVSVCPILRLPIHYSVVPHYSVYKILSPLINKIHTLSFIFHLYDFLNVDPKKMHCILDSLLDKRELKTCQDIINFC